MIEDWRSKVDQIDTELIGLLGKRFELSRHIGREKANRGTPVRDEAREREVLASVLQRAGSEVNAVPVLEVYKSILAASRAEQEVLKSDDIADQVWRVAYQGIPGAYGEEAAQTYFMEEKFQAEGLPDFESVVQRVADGTYDYGVLPIENTSTGGILSVYDLLQRYHVQIVGERLLQIHHYLMAPPGASLEHIKTVCSHPQALRQCQEHIREKGWEVLPRTNTALSAQLVAKENEGTIAAIGSKRAAEAYSLEVLEGPINDAANNMTRFIVLSAKSSSPSLKPNSNSGPGKTSFIVTIPHVAGSLYAVIACLQHHNINMLKIESRPLAGHPFEYSFHIDIEGYADEPQLRAVFQELNFCTLTMKILGSYRDDSHRFHAV